MTETKTQIQEEFTFSPLFVASAPVWVRLPAAAAALWDLPEATHRWRDSALCENTKGRIEIEFFTHWINNSITQKIRENHNREETVRS